MYDRHLLRSLIALILVLGGSLLCVLSSEAHAQTQAAITYRDGNQPVRILVFSPGSNGRLTANVWDGTKWNWVDQGLPSGAEVSDGPAVLTFREGNEPRKIYVFVRGSNGRLYVNWWDGTRWAWAEQGQPGNTILSDAPAVVGFQETNQREKIYVFVPGLDGRLYVNWWDGAQWAWANQGLPPGSTVSEAPTAIAYRDVDQVQKIYAFIRGRNGRLYVNWWDGTQWSWADQGTPSGTQIAGTPAALTYLEGNQQKIFVFVRGADGRLHVNFWSGSTWTWAKQGSFDGSLSDSPMVVSHRDGTGPQRMYAFLRRDQRLQVNFWDGRQWGWRDQGAPPSGVVASRGAVSYLDESGTRRIFAFVQGGDSFRYSNFWEGSQWLWSNLSPPQPSQPPTGSGPPPVTVLEEMKDRCSGDVVLSPTYRADDDAGSFDPYRGGMLLMRDSTGVSPWSGRLPVAGHSYIRWWCHSTTGNWADPGTWRITGGRIGVGCTGDWDHGQVESCHPTAEVDLAPTAGIDWTPERSRCSSHRTRGVRARLQPNRLIEWQCLE